MKWNNDAIFALHSHHRLCLLFHLKCVFLFHFQMFITCIFHTYTHNKKNTFRLKIFYCIAMHYDGFQSWLHVHCYLCISMCSSSSLLNFYLLLFSAPFLALAFLSLLLIWKYITYRCTLCFISICFGFRENRWIYVAIATRTQFENASAREFNEYAYHFSLNNTVYLHVFLICLRFLWNNFCSQTLKIRRSHFKSKNI